MKDLETRIISQSGEFVQDGETIEYTSYYLEVTSKILPTPLKFKMAKMTENEKALLHLITEVTDITVE